MVTIHDGRIAKAFRTLLLLLSESMAALFRVAQVAKGQTDMTAVLDRFDEADPDGVFISLFPAEADSKIGPAQHHGRT